jgi:lipid A 3-O-deacylase
MTNKKSPCAKVLLFAGLLSLSVAASAFEDGSPAFYFEAGRAPHNDTSTRSLTIGAVLPWGRQHLVWGTQVTTYADLFLSQWRAPRANRDGHHNYSQLGVVAGWRFRFDEGASPWFFEAGLGGTSMNDRYESPDRSFSTRFQFTEQLGVGRNFGTRGEHELSLRIQHFSNGGIRKPNPGENFYKVRYLYRF